MVSIEQESTLFQPVRVGNVTLAHRVVLAPLTRFRADDAHVPTDIMADYYAQRASVPGTLLITEATFAHARGGGADNVPGIWSDEQIKGWKKVDTFSGNFSSPVVLNCACLVGYRCCTCTRFSYLYANMVLGSCSST